MSVEVKLTAVKSLSNASTTSIVELSNFNFKTLTSIIKEFLASINYEQDGTMVTVDISNVDANWVTVRHGLKVYGSEQVDGNYPVVAQMYPNGSVTAKNFIAEDVTDTLRLRLRVYGLLPSTGIPGEIVYIEAQNGKAEGVYVWLNSTGWTLLAGGSGSGGSQPCMQEIIMNAAADEIESGSAQISKGIFLVPAPLPSSNMMLFINGLQTLVGDGHTLLPAYFSKDGGTTASKLRELDATDVLFFSTDIAGYTLNTDDTITLHYFSADPFCSQTGYFCSTEISGNDPLIFYALGLSIIGSASGIGPITICKIPNPTSSSGYSLPVGYLLEHSIYSYSVLDHNLVYDSSNIVIKFTLPGSITELDFDLVKIFREKDGVITDVTVTSGPYAPDYPSRSIYASVTGFSQFYVVQGIPVTTQAPTTTTTTTASPCPAQTISFSILYGPNPSQASFYGSVEGPYSVVFRDQGGTLHALTGLLGKKITLPWTFDLSASEFDEIATVIGVYVFTYGIDCEYEVEIPLSAIADVTTTTTTTVPTTTTTTLTPATTTTTTETPTTTTTTETPTTTTTTTTEEPECEGYSGILTAEDLSFVTPGAVGYINGFGGSVDPSPIIIPEMQIDVIAWFNYITIGSMMEGQATSVYEIIINGVVYPIVNGESDLVSNPFVIGEDHEICVNYNEITTTTTTTTSTTTTTCYPYKCDYGPVYNFYAIDTGKLAPIGWRIPTDTDWSDLSEDLGGETIAGGKMKVVGYCDWPEPNIGATNESEFSAFPAELRGTDGSFGGLFLEIWWSSTSYSEIDCPSCAWSYGVFYNNSNLTRLVNNRRGGFNVRLVRDYYEGFSSTIQDYDGNIYDVIQIGTKLWTVQNLKTTHYNDGEIIPYVISDIEWSTLNTGAMASSDWETYVCTNEPTTTTTTTVCIRPEGLLNKVFVQYFKSNTSLIEYDILTSSVEDACTYLNIARSENFNGQFTSPLCAFASLTIGEIVYQRNFNDYDCERIPDGTYWAYFDDYSNPDRYQISYVVSIVDGRFAIINECNSITTTTTTTIIPTTTTTLTPATTTTTTSAQTTTTTTSEEITTTTTTETPTTTTTTETPTTTTTTETPTTTTTTTDMYDHVYIDFSSGTNGVGTIEDPKNTFAGLSLQDYTKYHVKRGTTIASSTVIDLSNRSYTVITDYGTGDIPKYRSTATGTCAVRFAQSSHCTIENLEVYTDLSNSLLTLVQLGTGTAFDGGSYNSILNCKLHDVKQGASDGGLGVRGGGDHITIYGCEIYNTGNDGIYLQGIPTNSRIENNHIHHINQNYAGGSVGFNNLGNGASGDSIQLNGDYDGFIIRNNIIDRSDAYTGNKYAIIINQLESQGLYEAGGVIEHNTIILRSTVLGGIFLGLTEGTIVRYNKFTSTNGVGSEGLIKLAGYRCVDIVIHNNLFYNAGRGIRLGYIYIGNPDYDYEGGSVNTQIYNNTFYNMTEYCIYNDGCHDVQVKNNIFYDTPLVFSIWGTPTWNITNSSYYEIDSYGTPGAGSNYQTGDPALYNVAGGDFHLMSGSVCRNNGVDVSLTEDIDGVSIPQETYPAIGAYEYIDS